MKASVIIPNLNGAGWLRDSIESVWAQTEQDFELIVIDNGSTDESLDIARSYCGRDRYTLIENAGNTGFSHAVNQGIAIAKGEYMALFNNDAFAEPDWLAELIKTADADPKIFAVSSLMLRYYEPELADDAGDYVTILGFACKRGDGLRASRYTKPCRIFSACGGAALYRKSILDEIGVFDELFFAYYEDVDLSWRANSFILTYFQKVDSPLNKRLIEAIVDSENVRGNGYVAMGVAARDEIVYNEDENPVTDLMNGKITFHQYMTPYTPAEDIEDIIEFDPDALVSALS